MTNRKETFTSDVRKCGYLKVGRSQLKAFFSGNTEQRQLAEILLCIQTYAYFSEGQVCTTEGTYICRPGEWITSYTKISGFTGIDRRMVKTRMKRLEHQNLLTIEHLGSYKRITLVNYAEQMQSMRTSPTTPSAVSTEVEGTGSSLFSGAAAFYAPTTKQEGGTER